MRICRVTAILVVFEQFGTVLRVLELFWLFWKLNFQAAIESAASAASSRTRNPRNIVEQCMKNCLFVPFKGNLRTGFLGKQPPRRGAIRDAWI